MSREQMASFLWRLEGRPARAGPLTFRDVAPNATHGQAIAWLARSGITQGVSPDRFEPTGTVTRGPMAAFLARLADQCPDGPAGDAPDPGPTTPAPDEAADPPPGADDGAPAPGDDATEPAPGEDDEVTHPAPGEPPHVDDGSRPGDDEVEDPAPGGPPGADDGQRPGEDDEDPDAGTDPGPAPPTGGVADMCDLGPLVEPLIGAFHDGATATDELPAADICTFAGEHGSVSVVRDAGCSDLDVWTGWRHEPASVDGLGDWALYEAPGPTSSTTASASPPTPRWTSAPTTPC